MGTPKNFRSAFNGFNREDVVKYIEYTNNVHTTRVNELSMEVEFLRGKLAAAQAAPAQDPAAAEALSLAQQKIAELEARCSQLEQERDAALAVSSDRTEPAADCAAQELEAYRRAERAERVANERAEVIYNRVNGVLSDATVKVEDAAAQLGQISERFLSQLSDLQQAVSGSKQALDDAAATMYALRPTGEEN